MKIAAIHRGTIVHYEEATYAHATTYDADLLVCTIRMKVGLPSEYIDNPTPLSRPRRRQVAMSSRSEGGEKTLKCDDSR